MTRATNGQGSCDIITHCILFQMIPQGYNSFTLHIYRLGGFFNWTMTYREDSEIQFLYGWLSEKSSKKRISGGWVNSHPTSPAVAAKIKTLGARKPVAWLVSNCKTKSHRELYVKKLQEHECFVEIARSYQFYLSFENSLCKDYATEKLFRALASDLVPVVMGGANYSKIVPPKSIINVQDFPSPEVLGKELMRLVEVRSVFL